MNKILVLLLTIFLLGACNGNDIDEEYSNGDEQPVNGQEDKEEVELTPITKEEAIQIVHEQLENQALDIEFSHEFHNTYVIHTFENAVDEFEIEYKKTYNWYFVGQETGEVKEITDRPIKVIGEAHEEVKGRAAEIIFALEQMDMETVSHYIDEEKGLLFSPYVNVSDDDLVFNPNQVELFFEDSEEYTWGVFDGKGNPIELMPKDYFERFIYNANYKEANEVVYNKVINRGNVLNNIKEYFENSSVVEFYVEGTEEYSGMDWRSINLVFDMSNPDDPKLIAIVNNEWTT